VFELAEEVQGGRAPLSAPGASYPCALPHVPGRPARYSPSALANRPPFSIGARAGTHRQAGRQKLKHGGEGSLWPDRNFPYLGVRWRVPNIARAMPRLVLEIFDRGQELEIHLFKNGKRYKAANQY
jgi:hypothetical protein